MEITFQKGIVIFFGILLVVILIFLGYMLNNKHSSVSWPPMTSPCPDYWLDGPNPDLTKNNPYISGSYCNPTKDALGSYMNYPNQIPNNYMDFTTSDFTGSGASCNKRTWASDLKQGGGVSWGGITYGVSNPCNATSTTTVNS